MAGLPAVVELKGGLKMKRSLGLTLILISLISTNSSTPDTSAAQSQNSSGELILADAVLFSREARAGFDLDALRSRSGKTYYPIAEGQGPTIQSIRARYGRPTAMLAEGIPVTVQTIYTDS